MPQLTNRGDRPPITKVLHYVEVGWREGSEERVGQEFGGGRGAVPVSASVEICLCPCVAFLASTVPSNLDKVAKNSCVSPCTWPDCFLPMHRLSLGKESGKFEASACRFLCIFHFYI